MTFHLADTYADVVAAAFAELKRGIPPLECQRWVSSARDTPERPVGARSANLSSIADVVQWQNISFPS